MARKQASGGVDSFASSRATAPAIDTDAVVEKWYADYLMNSPASRHVDAWNHLIKAKEALKLLLKGE